MPDQHIELKEPKDDKDWWDNLNQAQQEHINEGLSDSESGRVHPSSVFWDKLRNDI